MKGGHNKKSVRVEFVMSEPEAELVKERMAELGITNLSAYLRKMAVDGYIIHLDMGDIQEMIRLLRICSNNLNQYTRRANETGSIYAADIEDIRTRLDSLWDGMDKLIRGFANISYTAGKLLLSFCRHGKIFIRADALLKGGKAYAFDR